MQIEYQQRYSITEQQLYQPLKDDLKQLQEYPQYFVQFCKQQWITVQLGNLLTIYREYQNQLFYKMEIQLSILFGQEVTDQVHTYFFTRLNDNNWTNHLLICGSNRLILYNIQYFENTFKMEQHDSFNCKFEFEFIKITEDEDNIYILNNSTKLLTINLVRQFPKYQVSNIQEKKMSIFDSFKAKCRHYINSNKFCGSAIDEHFVIAQQMNEYQVKLILCTKSFIEEDVHILSFESQPNILINTLQFGIIDNKLTLYLILIFDSYQGIELEYRQIKLVQYQIELKKLDNNRYQLNKNITPRFLHLNNFKKVLSHSVNSHLLIIQNQCHLIYSVDNKHYYHDQNNQEHILEGQLLGFGWQESLDNQIFIKIALNDSIKLLNNLPVQHTPEIITPDRMKAQNQAIYSILTEGLQRITPNNQSLLQIKIQLQNYRLEEVYQVINQITYDIMEQPISKYTRIDEQLKIRYDKLDQWKQMITKLNYSKSSILHIIECQIYLEIGQFIFQNESIYFQNICNCLEIFNLQQSSQIQFYSKLIEMTTIFEQIFRFSQNQKTLELIHICYNSINNLHLNNCKLFINQVWWHQNMSNIFRNQQNFNYQDLLKYILEHYSQSLQLGTIIEQQAIQNELLIILELSAQKIEIETIIDLLLNQELHTIIFKFYCSLYTKRLYNQSLIQNELSNSMISSQQLNHFDVIFNLLSNSQDLCQIFMKICIDQETQLIKDDSKISLLNNVLNDIINKNCVQNVYNALQEFPKLQLFLAIKSQKLELMNNTREQIVIQECGEFRFLAECAREIKQYQNLLN